MKTRENCKPYLRPILNKHRKSPSLVPSSGEPNALKSSSSVSSLPRIFKTHSETRSLPKRQSKSPMLSSNLLKPETRNITTPCFHSENKPSNPSNHLNPPNPSNPSNPHHLSNPYKPDKVNSSISKFKLSKLNLHQCNFEISFGSSKENFVYKKNLL